MSCGVGLALDHLDLDHMALQMNIAEAKSKLSELVNAAAAGDTVVIARAGKPIVKLVPIEEPPARELGFLNITIDDAFFDALDEAELKDWE